MITESEHGIFNAILRGHIDFTSDPWPSISPQAKDLVKKMLTSDPKSRLTAHQVLCTYLLKHVNYRDDGQIHKFFLCFSAHPWIVEDGEAPDKPLGNAVLGRLKQFKAMNNFKKVALRVRTRSLSHKYLQLLVRPSPIEGTHKHA